MSDSWRDLITDAIQEQLMVTYGLEFDAVHEEARDLCDAIFDTLDVDSKLQDVPWNTIGRAIKGRDFSVL